MPNIATLLEKILTPQATQLLRTAGELTSAADGPATAAYLVGGPVRDTFLGRIPTDIDIAVTGDAHKFSILLAERGLGEIEASSPQFQTATVTLPSGRVDIAATRSESYAEPGALPSVQPTGIRLDLARRDFTVNAMAVNLDPAKWGDLIDPFGGFSDTARRRLRVLHDGSFTDDPTRIFRALRYESRLGLRIDAATLALMQRDWRFMDRVSAARVRAELELVLRDPSRAGILASAEEKGVLAAIDTSFRVSRGALEAMKRRPDRSFIFYLSLATASLTLAEARALVTRLSPPAEWTEVIMSAPRYRGISAILRRDDLSRSEIWDLLSDFPEAALEAQRELAPDGPQKLRLSIFLERLRHVRPEISGSDLLGEGVPQGPDIGRLLRLVRRAKLDGKVTTKQEELEFAMRSRESR